MDLSRADRNAPERGYPVPARGSAALGAAALVWVSLVGAGMAVVWRYELRAGTPAGPPAIWPHLARIGRSPGLPALVLAIHPRCPCSRATLGELARLMTRCNGRVVARILLLNPDEVGPGWERTDLAENASRIPGVEVLTDEGGVEAALFGASTSGQAMLYDAAGRLVFSGGITGSRGHEGDNPGEDAVVEWILRGVSNIRTSPVFGCSLRDAEGARPGEGGKWNR